jgi:hypothetical protein
MNKSKINTVAVIMLFLSLICLFAGISYSIFSYFASGMTSNAIHTGKIVFSYSDSSSGGNGINIENALPISDDMGKMLSGEGEYFDFTVSASTSKTNLSYEVTVKKDDNSTLSDKWVKVYLTEFVGNQEKATSLTAKASGIVTYDELSDTENSSLVGKTVYYGTVQAGEVAYGKKFRLRIWVKDPNEVNFDYSTLNDKYFSVKVNVAASAN